MPPASSIVYASSSSVYGSNKKCPTAQKIKSIILYLCTLRLRKSDELWRTLTANSITSRPPGCVSLRLRSCRTPGHGLLWIYQQTEKWPDNWNLQLRKMQTRFHLHRWHRRRCQTRHAGRSGKKVGQKTAFRCRHMPFTISETATRKTYLISLISFSRSSSAQGVPPADYDFETHKSLCRCSQETYR